jgi:hypothetical protein
MALMLNSAFAPEQNASHNETAPIMVAFRTIHHLSADTAVGSPSALNSNQRFVPWDAPRAGWPALIIANPVEAASTAHDAN